MRLPKPTTVDFETEKINGRPAYPPIPVGVSIKPWGKKARYYAWSHPTENNCDIDTAKKALQKAYANSDGILCHNTKFDIDVAETHMGLKRLHWSKYHDTVFLLFLHNPHENDLGLKPSSERHLGIPPEEQDAVRDWLMEHQPVEGIKLSDSRKSPNYWAGYISYAPGKLVGKYANGDTIRTEGLFKFLWKDIADRDMLPAYDRERELMPILLDNERQGIKIDLKRLRHDVAMYTAVKSNIEAWIYKTTKSKEPFKIDSGAQLVDALARVKMLDKDLLGVTATGKYQTNKKALERAVTNKAMSAILQYRKQLGTCLNTFMGPWLETAIASKGLIFTWWNQTKNERGGGDVGTRTGRLSSTPNFQNIPNTFAIPEISGRSAGAKFLQTLPPLPDIRGYIVPWSKKHVLIDRDYSQQELRILAHFEDGQLLKGYEENPWLDIHDYAKDLINNMLGTNFERKPIKNTGFGMIYGMGLGLLAEMSGITVDEAKKVKDAYLAVCPGLSRINKDMKLRAKAGVPIRTWGGREYYCEPPAYSKKHKRMMTFEYKLLNILIQGSAADCTKQAIINYSKTKSYKNTKFYLNVHDELLSSVPRELTTQHMQDMRKAMEAVKFDLPMLSEGEWSDTSWADMKEYDKKGVTTTAYKAQQSKAKRELTEYVRH